MPKDAYTETLRHLEFGNNETAEFALQLYRCGYGRIEHIAERLAETPISEIKRHIGLAQTKSQIK